MVFVTGDEMTGCDPGASSACYSRMTTIAYDATSGTPRWLARYAVDGSSIFPGQILASADGEEVFVIGVEQLRGTMTTIAYTASTGAERWVGHDRDLRATYVIGNRFADWAGISADGRTLFIAGSVGGFRHGVAAYATKDGVKFWTLETSRSSWSWPMIVPSPMSDIVFLADQNHDDYLITGIDAAKGRELWRSTYDEAGRDDYPIEMAVPADGSRVFVTVSPRSTVLAVLHPRRSRSMPSTDDGCGPMPPSTGPRTSLRARSKPRVPRSHLPEGFLTFGTTPRRREAPQEHSPRQYGGRMQPAGGGRVEPSGYPVESRRAHAWGWHSRNSLHVGRRGASPRRDRSRHRHHPGSRA